jgi:hypothetical protein
MKGRKSPKVPSNHSNLNILNIIHVGIEKLKDNKNDFGKLRINLIVNKVTNDEIISTIHEFLNAATNALGSIYDKSLR